ncbi:hypothetical protein E2C01_012083 [Portunus trituberculatus]|uniref:Uncharacterized protein n=1 Tax=Portunus trituberculatus TaxID=210409 RepID=A0A5B7DD31_PORTR|nr:hypothetical protein [Portunus trituberculatus]
MWQFSSGSSSEGHVRRVTPSHCGDGDAGNFKAPKTLLKRAYWEEMLCGTTDQQVGNSWSSSLLCKSAGCHKQNTAQNHVTIPGLDLSDTLPLCQAMSLACLKEVPNNTHNWNINREAAHIHLFIMMMLLVHYIAENTLFEMDIAETGRSGGTERLGSGVVLLMPTVYSPVQR